MSMMDDNVDDQDDDTYIMRVGSNCLLICSNITLLILGFVSCRTLTLATVLGQPPP